MTIYRLDLPRCESGEVVGRFTSLASRLANRFAGLRNAIRNRRSVKQLVELDDYMLGDIGLTRGDVVSAISGTIGDDPGRRLSFLVSARRRAERNAAMDQIRMLGGYPPHVRRRSGNIVEL